MLFSENMFSHFSHASCSPWSCMPSLEFLLVEIKCIENIKITLFSATLAAISFIRAIVVWTNGTSKLLNK